MSLIAGTVAVTSWLTLGGLFAAHITGNIVIMAAAIVQGRPPHKAQTIPVFVLGVMIADLIARRVSNIPNASSLHLLSLQTALLGGASLLGVPRLHALAANKHLSLVQAMLAISAMTIQNALLHLTRKRVPTTAVMTGNLVQATIAALDLLHPSARLAGEENWNATWPLIASFVLGCALGALLVKWSAPCAWLVPAGLSLCYVLWFYATAPAPEAIPESMPL